VAPVKFVPGMTIDVPTEPAMGMNELMVGSPYPAVERMGIDCGDRNTPSGSYRAFICRSRSKGCSWDAAP
jgi:hypothetical protein